MLRFGYKPPLSPIGDWLLKILKILVLSKRKLVIRYVGVQVQTPSSCRPCPFCTYCHKVKHKRFYPAGWRESCEYRRYTPNEKREKVHANGSQNHKGRALVHERARKVFPSKVVVEPCEITFPRPALVVRLDDALLIAVPVVGNDATVNVSLPEEVWLLVLGLCALHDNTRTLLCMSSPSR